jgi:hypothetical protein
VFDRRYACDWPKQEPVMPRLLMLLCIHVFGLAAATTASAQSIDPAFERDVARLLETGNTAPTIDRLINTATGRLLDGIRQIQPDLPQRVDDITKEVARPVFTAAYPALLARFAGMVAKYFTHDEVRSLLAFYTSDLGKKITSLGLTLVEEAHQLGNDWLDALLPEFGLALQNRLKAEGLLKY